MNDDCPTHALARRAVVKLIAAAAAAPALLAGCSSAATDGTATAGATLIASTRRRGPAGTLSDPDLVNPVVPWPLSLDPHERQTLVVLCDLILPGDARSPAAGTHGADAFIDEWVSAPFDDMRADGVLLREGLAWLDAESTRRFAARDFLALGESGQRALCETICNPAITGPVLQRPALFFDRVRELCCIAHFTTAEGMADLGYVGNVALDAWGPPPPEVLRHVGLE